MTDVVTLRRVPMLEDEEWDRVVAAHPQTTIFHRSCWHRSLDAAGLGKVVRFEIERNGNVCGHWCGVLMTKFKAKVFGSPLPGTLTDYMYPLFVDPPAADRFLDGVIDWAKRERIAMVDVGGAYYPESTLAERGFATYRTRSYRVDLSGGRSAVWKRLKPSMRDKIRKAEKHGVEIRVDTPQEYTARYWDMLTDVFHRKGLTPPKSPAFIETVIGVLGKCDRVQTLMAWHAGQPVAANIVLMGDRDAYFWGTASYRSAYPVGANDLTTWHALQLAASRGLAVFDTCGGGEYKEKFGGPLVHFPAGCRSLYPFFGVVRKAVKHGFLARQVVLGRLASLRKRFS